MDPLNGTYAAAYDAARQQTVLFGASPDDGSSVTWIWDGTNWTQKSPANSPSPRYDFGLAYDAVHQQTLLFGGVESRGRILRGRLLKVRPRATGLLSRLMWHASRSCCSEGAQ
jgi:hypothetical protein